MSLLVEEQQRFIQAEADKDLVLRDFDILRKKFPDQYVGVLRGEVKYHDSNLDRLLDSIRSDLGTARGVLVLFMPSKERTIAV
jgi:hypothetical protein